MDANKNHFIFLVAILILGWIAYVPLHENAHVNVVRYWGTDSTVEIRGILDAETILENPELCTQNDNCKLANSLVEIVGWVVLVLSFGFGLIATLLYLILDKLENINVNVEQ